MNKELYTFITTKKHHALRSPFGEVLAEGYAKANMPVRDRMADRFEKLCAKEVPHILPGQSIVFMRSVADLPDVLTEAEWADIRAKHYVHELGYMSNLSPDYASLIEMGLEEAKTKCDPASVRSIDALLGLAEKYRALAKKEGRDDIADTLSVVPAKGAKTFRQALQMLRILHFAVWAEGNYHNTLGRFDLYMKPYYENDIKNGTISEDEAYELICDFFLDCNIDNDLYPGVQQGDNGQSMMLGGILPDGTPVYSDLSALCLRASAEIKLIDPKINLRVNKDTPLSVYKDGSVLTAVGLGFPQYSNDDIVIPGLEKLGYSHEDASNYAVAACWEFIIPGVGADIANIGALSFSKVIDSAFRKYIKTEKSIDSFYEKVRLEMKDEVDKLTSGIRDVWFVPSPIMDTLCGFTDISKGSRYNNFGLHGTGISCAADSLAAIEKYIYNEKFRTPEQYLAAVECDFESDTELLSVLRNTAPKLGQNTGEPEKWARLLLHEFADLLDGRTNDRGGKWRAGTGSAMYYLWHADEIGATPDGRRKGEPLGTNYSVSLFAKLDGPVSIIDAFSSPDLTEVVNGGPLTLEFQQKMFDAPDGVDKVASLVQYFIHKGGHQLQLNAVSRETLLDAQKHPENYPHLIVRIWGWSAYFVELDDCYQNQVLRRQEYAL